MNDTIISKLQSENTSNILSGINEFAESGKVKHIPYVLNILANSIDKEVLTNISLVLGQLKHQESTLYLVEAIKDDKYHDCREEIIVACWENGLNYTEYISAFIDIMISSDFMLALEAHTVITNMTGQISKEIREVEQEKIKIALQNTNKEKEMLLTEVSEFLYALEDGILPMEY